MRAMRMLLTCCLALPGLAHAEEPCAEPVSPEAFGAALSEAHAEAVALHNDEMAKKMDEAAAMIPCLSGPVTPSMAADWHVLWGFLHVVESPEDAQRAYAAGRLANPDYSAAEVLGPSKSAMQRFEALPLEGRQLVTLKAPPQGQIYLDGAPTLERSAGWPVIYQWVGEDQKMMVSAGLGSTDVQPGFPSAAVEIKPPDGNGNGNGNPPPPKKLKPVKIALLAGAGAAGAVALVGVAGLVGSGADYEESSATNVDPPTALDWYAARESASASLDRNHSRGAMAVGGAAAAVGLGVVGIIIDF